ncbi:hypothetical protein BSKO_01889 [Bryopsis sp. KO-2023]|nr:hypothetical protein BSKO_01889 [Bryopsis sp. KO-2023]
MPHFSINRSSNLATALRAFREEVSASWKAPTYHCRGEVVPAYCTVCSRDPFSMEHLELPVWSNLLRGDSMFRACFMCTPIQAFAMKKWRWDFLSNVSIDNIFFCCPDCTTVGQFRK